MPSQLGKESGSTTSSFFLSRKTQKQKILLTHDQRGEMRKFSELIWEQQT